ncbi:MAG: MBL fold metallo-hydrolase [Acidobacteria bacterium]|nr:MBL fold metallo-hydrolase [Acidobacteriota bacterium]
MQRGIAFLVALIFSASSLFAHGDNSHFPQTQDVVVKTSKVNGNVYMLQGRGGNIGALVGMEGILIVDDDYKAVGEKLSAALKELGSATPKYILNTHWHGDHTQGNEMFGKTGTIIAHENVRKRLLDPPVIFGDKTAPYPAVALPLLTYTESISIFFNGEEVKAAHFPHGHTDGDTVVFFVKANVVHLGDDFFVGRFPFVDIDSGGSVQGLINNIGTLIGQIPADAKLIPGHGPVATVDDLKAYHSVLVETSKIVQDAMKAGKSLDEIKKAGLPEKFKEAGSGFIKTDAWIETIYRSYSKK